MKLLGNGRLAATAIRKLQIKSDFEYKYQEQLKFQQDGIALLLPSILVLDLLSTDKFKKTGII